MPRLKRRKSGEGVEYISCRLCRRSFRAVNASHLVHAHGFDWEHPVLEYKSEHGLSIAISFESRELLRDRRIAWLEGQGRRLERKAVARLFRAERTAGRSLLPTRVLRRFPTLHSSAVRIHGSWSAALAAAGLQPDLPNRSRVWSKAIISDRIRKIPANISLNQIQSYDPRLYAAARHYFGGWPEAVRAAGRTYAPPDGRPRLWTDETMIAALRDRARRGLSLRPFHVGRDLPGLLDAARDQYKDWRAFVRKAGLENRLPPVLRHWTRAEFATLLRDIRAERGTVTYDALRRFKRKGLYTPLRSVKLLYGTLSRARLAIGLPAKEWRARLWTLPKICQAIKDRIRRGLPLGCGIMQETAPGLVSAAKEKWRTWRQAVEALGGGHLLSPAPFRWTEDAVVKRIRILVRAGRSIDQNYLRRSEPKLVRGGIRRFMTWLRAVEAAGCSAHLTSPPRHWKRDELIGLMHNFLRRTGRLSSEDLKNHKRPGFMGPMYSITRVFGSFPAAKRAAGLSHIPSYHVRHWTHRTVIQGLRDRARRGLPMNYTSLEQDCYPLLRALYARFGSITTAFRAARIKHVSFQRHRQNKRQA